MQIEIKYEYLGDRAAKFWATSTLNGEAIWSCGDSWEQARERHLENVKNVTAPRDIPPPEEVEI